MMNPNGGFGGFGIRPPAQREPEEEPQDEIPRNAEEMGDADLLQIGDQEVAEGHRGAHAALRSHHAKNATTSPAAIVTVWAWLPR